MLEFKWEELIDWTAKVSSSKPVWLLVEQHEAEMLVVPEYDWEIVSVNQT